MLVELSVMEQRYHAVMEVVSGAPVSEVARRYGVSRQAVHGWLGRYEREGLAGLADHSHRRRVSRASWTLRLRRWSASCGGRIRGGVHGGCCSSLAKRG
jgi:transposase